MATPLNGKGRIILGGSRSELARKDLKEASNHWSGQIKALLARRFGAGQYGHCLIIFGLQRNPILTYITDGRHKDVARLLRELADNIDAQLGRPI